MSIDRTRAIEWDGKVLSGWIIVAGIPKRVAADRMTIHSHAPGFNDALTWEINRFRVEIFEKMTPFFRATICARCEEGLLSDLPGLPVRQA